MSFEPLANFESLDDSRVYKNSYSFLEKVDSLNFVVEFDDSQAYVAQDLGESEVEALLAPKRTSSSVTRWICIFGPERQQDLIKYLGHEYHLSPRLIGIICAKPATPQLVRGESTPKQCGQDWAQSWPRKSFNVSSRARAADAEKDSAGDHSDSDAGGMDLSHYNIVDEVWHYCSTDWSSRSVCIGYNALSGMSVETPTEYANDEGSSAATRQSNVRKNTKNKPNGRRVWTWLLLCDDNTVISIQENLFPRCKDDFSLEQAKTLKSARRNLRNVFKQLSSVNADWRALHPLQTLDLRKYPSQPPKPTGTRSDTPGLLFYYLFDDWYTTYGLVAKEEQRYSTVLNRLRERMFEKAVVARIQQLHETGRQLAVLKRMYQSYALIIERIVDRHKAPKDFDPKDNPTSWKNAGSGQHVGDAASDGEDETFRTPLTAKAVVKFERLKDRIELYALSEIQECLDEKESLVFLNFNLITMRQSEAVEKLTRITILLAKVTILFMPVSLMTGYFSIQIPEVQNAYSAKTYWVCFAVIMALSFLFLVAFGIISHTLEGGLIYKSTTGAFIALFKRGIYSRGGRRFQD